MTTLLEILDMQDDDGNLDYQIYVSFNEKYPPIIYYSTTRLLTEDELSDLKAYLPSLVNSIIYERTQIFEEYDMITYKYDGIQGVVKKRLEHSVITDIPCFVPRREKMKEWWDYFDRW